jgi:hypothetical protein
MLPNGKYSAWFNTPLAGGVGVIELLDGRLSGGDTTMTYSGSYVQDGDSFTATIATRRHSAGQAGILGLDEVEIDLEGTSRTTTAGCAGKIRQQPEVPFEVVLVRIES